MSSNPETNMAFRMYAVLCIAALCFFVSIHAFAARIIYDPYADVVTDVSITGVLFPENALGEPDGVWSEIAGVGSWMTLDMGRGEEGTRGFNLHYGLISINAQLQVNFLDESFSSIKTTTQNFSAVSGPGQAFFDYQYDDFGKPYRYITISSLAGVGLNVDAIESVGYIGKTPTTDTDGDGIFDRIENENGTNPLDPLDPIIEEVIEEVLSPPSVLLTEPTSGATLAGTVTLFADAYDDLGVGLVQFKYNGTSIGPADTVAPYAVNWDTTTVPNGLYVLTATAIDVGDTVSYKSDMWWQKAMYAVKRFVASTAAFAATTNQTVSSPVVVTVDNPSEDESLEETLEDPKPESNEEDSVVPDVTVVVENNFPEEQSTETSKETSAGTASALAVLDQMQSPTNAQPKTVHVSQESLVEATSTTDEMMDELTATSSVMVHVQEEQVVSQTRSGYWLLCVLLAILIVVILFVWADYRFVFFDSRGALQSKSIKKPVTRSKLSRSQSKATKIKKSSVKKTKS